MNIIAVAMQKGGTGKTTTALNLGAAIAEQGKSVLLIDFDPQASLTTYLGYGQTPERIVTTMYPVIHANINDDQTPTLHEAIIHTDLGLDFVPADISLSRAEAELVGVMGGELILQSILADLKHNYEVIIIDCSPSLGLMTINALCAANQTIIPVSADYLAMEGIKLILNTIGKIRGKFNPELQISGVLLTMVEPRTVHNRLVMDKITNDLTGVVHVYDSVIPKTIKVKESALVHQSMLNYAPAHPVSNAYREIAKEVLNHE